MKFKQGSPKHQVLVFAVFGLIAALVLSGCGSSTDTGDGAAAGSVTVTDIAGRQVTLKAPVERMVLGEGRLLYLTALLDKEDPISGVVGWPDDLKKTDQATFDKYEAKFPEIDRIPEIGSFTQGTVSQEKVIDLRPDVVIMTKDNYKGAQEIGAVATLEKVGIPTVVVDFRDEPLKSTVPGIELLGKITGREAQAAAFTEFYDAQMKTITDRVAKTSTRPKTFLYTGAGLSDCCSTWGDANLGSIVKFAGGENLGTEIMPGAKGSVAEEQVFASNPDIIIVTGSDWRNQDKKREDVSYVNLGYEADPAQARKQTDALMHEPGWGDLAAVKQGRTHALWHQFYTSPYNFLAAQQIAKWQHPEAFGDVDPTQNFRELHEKFLPVEYSGTFWTQS
ncbi:MAG: ABC transporter substrate-binding protein [Gordonia sp. (in: high G+C Gram-positive bacteria)]|uniref:ABC transporter substrate-binding protein n=1 Tax=Gordonia sp. (in: high G+C Gram-positive bacteria) TaxID=84139 RepID=UPI0039E2FB8C